MSFRALRAFSMLTNAARPRAAAMLLVAAAHFVAAARPALAIEPVPPVPGKRGTQGPREGFAAPRLPFAGLPDATGASRAPLAAQVTHNVLAIRVAFSDRSIDSSTAYYDRILFFMNQYWSQTTDGLHVINATLVDSVFTLPQTMAYYGDDDRFQERLVFLVRDLVALADPTVDFRNKELVIFHAGQGQEADVLDDSHDQIWSAFVTASDFDLILPDPSGLSGIATNDLVSPGVPWRVKEATELPESESQDGYVFGMTGVTCHEYGHQLGLPDLYDTTDENGSNQGLAGWDIMAGGVWNGNGFVPGSPSAWSRARLGVIAPQRVLADGAFQLSRLDRPVAPYPRAIQIQQTQSEYLLLENRDQDPNRNGKFDFEDTNLDGFFDFYTDSYLGAEFDFFLPGEGSGSGITVYHVDDAKVAATIADNVVNGDTSRKGVDVVEADGIQDLDEPFSDRTMASAADVFRGAGGTDALTPDTNPSTEAYGGVRSGISITGISGADSVMSFNVAIARNRPGFPKILNTRLLVGATLAADVDGDGVQELLVPARRTSNPGELYVFEPDGTDYLDGDATPTAFIGTPSPLAGSPCVGDIDGFAGNEIVFQTLNGAIYAFHDDGSEVLDGDNNVGTIGVLVGGGGLPTRAQPILVDLDGLGGMEIVLGSSASPLGSSLLTAVKVSGGVVSTYTIPMYGSTSAPPAAADLDGDGFPEVVVSNVATVPGEDLSVNGLSVVNWETFTDPNLPRDPENAGLYFTRAGRYGPPTLVNLDRDAAGTFEALMADRDGAFHAFHFDFAAHIPGDPPNSYITAREVTGWPAALTTVGRAVEVSAADLEGDGYPELFQTGDDCRLASFHWNGAPRSGFPVRAGDPLSPSDSSGVWAPMIADVDGDGALDVIAVLPDGKRLAYHRDGSPIPSFAELGSTGLSGPPILADLDGDGLAEWVEAYDLSSQFALVVRNTTIAVGPGSLSWNQWRRGPTRNAVLPTGPAGGTSGTQVLSEVYAYPNPSSGSSSTIHYRLSGPATSVRVSIYDPSGALVAEPPVDAADLAGSAEHAVVFDHAAMSSGVYVCRVEVNSPAGKEVKRTRLAVVR
ncbi:MAG TPA: M6 family metalloprotease domain-containing protein [Candidatus Eisenbacteria bacterium]|nr:M6 family metalloprotease domain-containing protein [Candidatus Eisenbacteria bacterium]